MKRFLCVCMCVFILTISVITYLPVYAADNDFTLSIPSTADYYNIPASEVSSAISNRGDIYGSDHVLMWRYTPTSTYNWTSADKALWDYTHFSDAQLSAVMQSSNAVSALAAFFSAASSNNNIFSSLLSGAGALVSGNSDLFTSLYDKFTGNKNYLDAIEYDPNTGDLTLLADQVTALRKELKDRYYNLIGLKIFNSSDNVHIGLSSSKFKNFYQYQEDYASDFATFYDYDYMFLSNETAYFFNNFEYAYYNLDENLYFSATSDRLAPIYFIYSDTVNKLPSDGRVVVSSGYDNVNSSLFFNNVLNIRCNADYGEFALYYGANKNSSDTSYTYDRYGFSASTFYGNKSLRVFKSYSAYYNYVHGDENAYLSSKVEEAGEDIKLSIRYVC